MAKNDDDEPKRPRDLETTTSKKSDPNRERSDNSGDFSHSDDRPERDGKTRKRD